MLIHRFFFKRPCDATYKHQLSTCHENTLYLSNLLTVFIQAEQLFAQTEDGLMLKALARMYAEAADARSVNERDSALRHLGDVALFISGLFPQSLSRSLMATQFKI
jgi:hypothetical protein